MVAVTSEIPRAAKEKHADELYRIAAELADTILWPFEAAKVDNLRGDAITVVQRIREDARTISDEDLLTVSEAAAMAGVTPAAIRHAIQLRRIPTTQHPTSRMHQIRRGDVRAYIASKRTWRGMGDVRV